jgi:UDP-N-acetylglucosamine diphosphorylase / glucose-1-phosphate thymidylyltransferase / UDP-N-acetylgalactosamine diphosphorylase / glucosamine-1-phosphate N-acetyltransferase / galactosamine-1-phosphate N-acetyltransferase
MKNELVAVVLAGGSGSRFWPFQTNKVLFPFMGKPLFYYSVMRTLPKSVSRMVIIASDSNRSYFENLKLPFPHLVVVQAEAHGMADALLTAKSMLTSCSLFIYIADHLVDSSVPEKVLAKSEATSAFAVLPGWQTDTYFPGGYFTLENDRVLSIVEKPGTGNEPSKYVDVSGHYISDSEAFFSALQHQESIKDDIYENALTELAAKTDIRMEPFQGISSSLKYPWDVLKVMQDLFAGLKSQTGKNVQIKSNVVIEGEVVIGDNVKIFENTKITGPCYIGDNTIIGNNNIIRSSHIGANCVTGFNTDITRSYVGNSCWFHSNYIGDSVLEENISLGSGAVLANLRLDEADIFSNVKSERINTNLNKLGACIGKNVRIGVNTSTMPGIKIGSGSLITSAALINRDIPDNNYVECETKLNLKPNRQPVPDGNRDNFRKKI